MDLKKVKEKKKEKLNDTYNWYHVVKKFILFMDVDKECWTI